MSRTIDYYLATNSPWAYLGHERFVALAAAHDASIDLVPVDLARVFPVSGGLPLAKRAPQRQEYRLVELRRWSEYLGIPIHLEPKYLAAPPDVGARWVLAALEQGIDAGLAMAGGVMRARWAEEADTADPDALGGIARRAGLDATALAALAQSPGIQAKFDANTERAIEARVFGSPWYVYRGEPFWGQDRLDFLARALAK